MLISNKVIELNNQIRNEKLELQQEMDMIYYELDPISKLRLNRINSLINDLTLTIGELSGWIYSPNGFTLKSNYRYDKETGEITFDLNRVSKDEGVNPAKTIMQAFYNAGAKELNTKILTFPTNLINNMVGHFKKRDYFEVEESEKAKIEKAPDVKF